MAEYKLREGRNSNTKFSVPWHNLEALEDSVVLVSDAPVWVVAVWSVGGCFGEGDPICDGEVAGLHVELPPVSVPPAFLLNVELLFL